MKSTATSIWAASRSLNNWGLKHPWLTAMWIGITIVVISIAAFSIAVIAADISQPVWDTKLSDTGDCYNFYYGNPAGITAIENCKE